MNSCSFVYDIEGVGIEDEEEKRLPKSGRWYINTTAVHTVKHQDKGHCRRKLLNENVGKKYLIS
jgi:hypothetical protein